MSWRHLYGLVPAFLLTFSCSDDDLCAPRVITSDQECKTTADCTEAGFRNLTCLNGTCRMTCTKDTDCVIEKAEKEELEACPGADLQPAAVCESQICVPACPDVPCAHGTCVKSANKNGGRCAIHFESFEIPSGQDFVDLENLGWNSSPREKANNLTTIAWEGEPSCSKGDRFCAGIASHGSRFVYLERVPTPERGTADVGPTCRDCACCLECILDPPKGRPTCTTDASCKVDNEDQGTRCLPHPNTGVNGCYVAFPKCPRAPGIPVASACPAQTSTVCDLVCHGCSSCSNADTTRIGERVLSCEEDSALKACTACPTCDTCTLSSCSICQSGDPADAAACEQCRNQNCPSCADCIICSDAVSCELTDPGSAECRAKRLACDNQGSNGCYPTPINYPREQLTLMEQSLESPNINVSGVDGRLVIQFEYVPFNVADKYKDGDQGTPISTWRDFDQEVIIQLCAGDCDNEANWKDANLATGGAASFPPMTQRRNGLSLGSQSGVDWRSGRLEVNIDNSLRTDTFRFRFVPKLAQFTRVGIDNIWVRQRQ